MPNKTHFRYYEDFGIFPISNIRPIWAVQKCSGVIFRFFDEKWKWRKIFIKPFKLKILNLTFLTWWPLMTFIWHKATKDLGGRGFLEVSQTRSTSFLGFLSIWYGCFAWRSQQGQKKTFDSPVTSRIKFCHIFERLNPGAIKCRFRIENRPSSLAYSRGPKFPPPPPPIDGPGPGIPPRGVG